ncbi:MAG: SoxR reducing system RseC family protein [Alkalispirochaeta sp.]
MNHPDNQCRVVSQNGRVMSVRDDVANIQIVQTSACASCRIKGICAAGDAKAKVITVPAGGNLREGMAVRLEMAERYGWIGVILAFLVPLLLVVTTLFLLRKPFGSEELAALAGLGTLVPYYGVLYLTREYFIKTIQFSASPIVTPRTFATLHKEGVQ